MASVGLGALGDYKVGGVLALRHVFNASIKVGDGFKALRGGEPSFTPKPVAARTGDDAAPQGAARVNQGNA